MIMIKNQMDEKSKYSKILNSNNIKKTFSALQIKQTLSNHW